MRKLNEELKVYKIKTKSFIKSRIVPLIKNSISVGLSGLGIMLILGLLNYDYNIKNYMSI